MNVGHRTRNSIIHPQIKICGLTRTGDARACVRLGADAIGCVFYPPSPRHVDMQTARGICRAIVSEAAAVGVFVNQTFGHIMRRVEYCGLTAVQLHGQESAQLVAKLRRENLVVVKVVFIDGSPSPAAAGDYDASAFLVECTGGPLPGGNAMAWNWATAADLARRSACILAGGLNADNVGRAMAQCHPAAVDVSSGVELAAGRKDLQKVAAFTSAVAAAAGSPNTGTGVRAKIF